MSKPLRTTFFAVAPRQRTTSPSAARAALFEEVALPGGQSVTLIDAAAFDGAVRSADAKINAILRRGRSRHDA